MALEVLLETTWSHCKAVLLKQILGDFAVACAKFLEFLEQGLETCELSLGSLLSLFGYELMWRGHDAL